jgi:hypothetical protein
MLSKVVKCGVRLALALIMGLALLTFLVIPVQAQSSAIDLVLSGEEATSWNISDIGPGDSGTKTVRLHNAGRSSGSVTIWISDVVSSEGINPESETGDTTEPGELSDHLRFALSCNRLDTNITLPAALQELPQSAADSHYVKIEHLYAGETLTLIWQWEFLETGEPQNDAQGDSLSFTINYLLEELPSGGGGGGGRGGGGGGSGAPSYQRLRIDILGSVTMVRISSSGEFLDYYVATDPDNRYKLELEKGTKITCTSGEVLGRIEMKLCDESLSTPTSTEIIGPAFELTGYTKDSVPCPVIFSQPARLTLSYDTSWLPEDTSSVFMAFYDADWGWKELKPAPAGAAELGEITALISHTSTFAILARLEPSPLCSPPLPAHFVATDLSIAPSQEQIWESITFLTRIGGSVTISANIANDGGQEETYIVELKIDGEIVDTKEVTIGAGQKQQVSFTLSKMDYGQHRAEVAGLNGEFTVSRSITWSLIIGIIAAIGLIAWGVVWARKKRVAQDE